MPVVLWQIWRFIVPALHAKEKRYAIPFILTSIALFFLGALLAYLTLGKALEFLISWSGSDVGALFEVDRYVRLVGLMVAAFGIGFQFPVLLVFLQLVGVITPQQLIKSWRYALIGIVVVAAVITPSGDPISLAALAVPMTILYFLSLPRRAPVPAAQATPTRRRLRDWAPMTERPDRAEIVGGYPFPLDHFQLEALDALDAGRHVVVAAPTGSGKTVVAEYGIETTRRDGRRSFYTAPMKALSNQKFRDLRERYGVGRVGLLTGDNAIDGEAPVVVMTTEVLRNMIYAGSSALDDLGLVVLDEVHFLQDTYRGPVWEEVIIHLPPHVRLICLSATVSNTAELAAWIETVRGPTDTGRRAAPSDPARRLLPRRRPHQRPDPPAGDVRRRPPQPRRHPPRRVGRAPQPGRPSGPQRPSRAGQRQARAVRAGAGGDRRAARGTPAAAGDRVHLQSQPVRRGGPLVPGRRTAPDHRGRAPADPQHRRHPAGRSRRRGPRGARLRPVRRPSWRPASPPTTPAWCRRSRRPSRPASSRG